MMKILHVAYPYEPVSPESAGGTEQILALLDRELTRLGHESLVVARAGSRVAGRLVEGAPADADFDASCRAHYAVVDELLAGEHVDLVHNQGSELQHRGDRLDVPLLTTIHLARRLYPRSPFVDGPRRHYNFVSRAQRREYARGPVGAPVIPNGIATEQFRPAGERAGFALAIGRICPEKGFHHAIAAARLAGVELVLVGKVYRFEGHERYFRDLIEPWLGHAVRFIDSPTLETKRGLLAAARCVLIPSEIEETSSLVAMEAAASGTPAICFRRGALAEVVEDGTTGFVVDGVDAMAAAIGRSAEIDGAACRRRAERRFSGRRMAARYVGLYRRILAAARGAAEGAGV